jgi:micrococcal nuclease
MGHGVVTRVVDGDAVYVAVGNTMEKVRYIAVNTPEIHHPTKGKEPYGAAARAANARLVEGQQVKLVLDVQQRDRDRRLLAYVYVGDRFVNAELVWQGYAEASTYPPNVRYAEYFVSLQRRAREANRGLWRDPDAVAHHRPRPPDYVDQPVPPPSSEPSTVTGAPAGGRLGAPSRSQGSQSGGGEVQVQGYTRSDGTYVAPHTRSAPGDRKR